MALAWHVWNERINRQTHIKQISNAWYAWTRFVADQSIQDLQEKMSTVQLARLQNLEIKLLICYSDFCVHFQVYAFHNKLSYKNT